MVVIGGGIIGTSIAYHLGELGWSDTVLLERDKLTSGTTWHAAGLMVTFGSLSETSTELRKYTKQLYSSLEAKTGLSTGFKPVGFIEVAADPGRLEEYRRVAAFNRICGIEVHEISPAEVGQLFPIADTSDLLAGFYVPDDGRVNPVDATMSLARGARMFGVSIAEGVSVHQVLTHNNHVRGVRTSHGDIECEYVVNCAGIWARQLGAADGISIPLQASEHYYLITDRIPGLDLELPVLEDPSRYGYYRPEGDGLMVGLFEPKAAPWGVASIPHDFSFGEIPPDWDRMAGYLETAMSRVPITQQVGLRKFFCGPESFTPDLAPIIGQSPEVTGYFVAAGLNSIGILTGGGWGRAMAHWISTGTPDIDMTGVNIDRLHPFQSTARYRQERTAEALGMVYATHFPNRSMSSARGAKRSPIHHALAAHGACFRDVSGWEGADWFAGAGCTPAAGDLTWQRPDWFDHWAAEHTAVRTGVGLMDMSFMAKFAVEGPDAQVLLESISANRVGERPGRITYTQWLNHEGLIEADVTVTKIADGTFWVVASDTAHRHVLAWLQRHGLGLDVTIRDETGAWAQLNLQGPLSRALMSSITETDMSNTAFPFRDAHRIDVGFAQVLCTRITYVGELGYELYVPAEHAGHGYEVITEAGPAFGLAHVGLKALSSLRMEKAYRDYGHDIDNTDDPYQAGLAFAVALNKPVDFIGKQASAARQSSGPPSRRLIQVLLEDPEPLLFHAEPVLRDGRCVGYIRAASYGHSLGAAVGLAMVHADGPVTEQWLDSGTWEVNIAERVVRARVSLRPMYDPSNARIRA